MEQAILEQYPGGDVAALGERQLSVIVAVFQELHERDELDLHVDLLASCNEHAAVLGESLENSDRSMIRVALAPVIDDFRLLSSTVEGN